tara:strand:- start:81 stop:257 length:177 start_codon:yes stop_codon:yes gene_type:complete
MSRFDEREIEIAQLTDELTDVSYINAVMQEALEMIASNTEEDRRTIAQETLESITKGK